MALALVAHTVALVPNRSCLVQGENASLNDAAFRHAGVQFEMKAPLGLRFTPTSLRYSGARALVSPAVKQVGVAAVPHIGGMRARCCIATAYRCLSHCCLCTVGLHCASKQLFALLCTIQQSAALWQLDRQSAQGQVVLPDQPLQYRYVRKLHALNASSESSPLYGSCGTRARPTCLPSCRCGLVQGAWLGATQTPASHPTLRSRGGLSCPHPCQAARLPSALPMRALWASIWTLLAQACAAVLPTSRSWCLR
jgi:hypothetical protein